MVHRHAEQRRDGATQPDRPLERGGVDGEADLLGQLARRRLPQRLPRLDLPARACTSTGRGPAASRGRPAGRRTGARAPPGPARAPARPAGPAGASAIASRTARSASDSALGGQRGQQVGTAGRGAPQRLARGASGRSRRGRRTAAPAAPRARARTPAGCRTGPRAARRRASRTRPDSRVADDAGQQPGDRLDHHQDGGLPAGQHVVADGDLGHRAGVGGPVGHPLVDALVAAAGEDQPGLGRPTRAASAWVNGRPAGRGHDQAGARRAGRRPAPGPTARGA